MIRRVILAVLALGAVALAQGPTLTTISQPTFGASGTVTVVANESFTTPDGFLVPKGYDATATVVAGGTLSIALPPNSGSSPSGTSYTAYYNVSPGGQYTETWIVPQSATPVLLSAVRTLLPPTPSYLFAWSQIEPPPNAVSGCLVEWLSTESYTCGTAGAGSVTSVALTLPSWLTVSGSPITTSGTLAVTVAGGQTVHEVLGTGSGSSVGLESLALADLPGSGAVTVNTTAPLGGGGSLSLGGSLTLTCTGCLTAVPAPTASTLGGAESYTAPAHEWLSALSTSGTWTASQPGFADIGGDLALGSQVSGVLAVANGGNGTASPALTAGTGIQLTGQWPDYTITATGGGGSMVYPGAGVANSTGSAWGTSYGVGTAADDLVQLNSNAQLPAVSAANLTNFPTLNQNTTGNAATATALATTPSQCPSTEIVTGVQANGDANCQDPLVSGATANGSAPAAGSNPVLTGGWDGTDVRTFSTDTSGRLNVNINGIVPVSGTFWQATQPVSLASLPALAAGTSVIGKADLLGNAGAILDAAAGATAPANTIQVGGVYSSTAPAPASGEIEPFQLDASGRLEVNCITGCSGGSGGGNVNVASLNAVSLGSPTDWGTAPASSTAVLPVNADVLALPALATGSNTIGNVNINGTVPVSGTFWQATQPVSLANLPALAAGTNTVGAVDQAGTWTVAISGTPSVSVSNFPATQPVSGTVTANAGTGFPIVPSASAAVNDSASGLTQIVAAVSGKAIYVTAYTVVANAAVSVQWEYGTGTNCGTGTTALTGPMSFAANGGAAPRGTLFVPAGDGLCLNLGAAVQVGGSVSYAQQ